MTSNLHVALLHLRNRFFERILWVDAVCINQDDDGEKGLQVQSMGEIYASANGVVVWLGEAADDSDNAFEELGEAARAPQEFLNLGEPDEKAIIAVLKRPWFERIWVSGKQH